MTDLAVLAAGFGAIPLTSILLYSFREWFDRHRDVVWGGLAGVVAFLGLSHAMAFVLEGKPFLFAGNDSAVAASFLFSGLAVGGLLGWVLSFGRSPHASCGPPPPSSLSTVSEMASSWDGILWALPSRSSGSTLSRSPRPSCTDSSRGHCSWSPRLPRDGRFARRSRCCSFPSSPFPLRSCPEWPSTRWDSPAAAPRRWPFRHSSRPRKPPWPSCFWCAVSCRSRAQIAEVAGSSP